MGTRADEYEHSRDALQLATITRRRRRRRPAPLRAEPLAHRRAVPPLRRHASASRSGSTSASTNDVKLRNVNPDGTQQSLAASSTAPRPGPGKPGERALHGQGDLAERHDRHRHRRVTGPSTRARSSRSTRATTPTRCAWIAANYTNGATVGHAVPQRRERPLHGADPERPDRQRPVAGRPLPRAERAARRPHPHVVGRRPGQRPERAVAHAAGLRHLHLRPGDAARTSSSTTTARPGTSTRSPSRRAPSRRSSATSAATARLDDPGPHRLGRHRPDRPERGRSPARSSATCRWRRRSSRARSRSASSRASRARPRRA